MTAVGVRREKASLSAFPAVPKVTKCTGTNMTLVTTRRTVASGLLDGHDVHGQLGWGPSWLPTLSRHYSLRAPRKAANLSPEVWWFEMSALWLPSTWTKVLPAEPGP